VTYLDESSFFVAENDVELDPAQHPLALGDPAEISTDVLILIDTTKKNDPQFRKGLERGLSHLLEKLGKARRVRVLGFDGRAEPSFRSEISPGSSTPELGSFGDAEADNARNLNGALATGFDELNQAAPSEGPSFGILVVVSFGPDTAGRLPNQELWKKLDSNDFPIYSAVPADVSVDHFGEVERIEFTAEDLPMRLMDLGMALRAQLESLYLLRYCSSARSGSRALAVRVHYEGTDGSPRGARARARKSIEASAFRAGCQLTPTNANGESLLAETAPAPTEVEETATEAKPEPSPTPLAPPTASTPKAKPPRPPPRSSDPKAPVVAPPSGEDYR